MTQHELKFTTALDRYYKNIESLFKGAIEEHIEERKEVLKALIEKFDYDVDKHRLNEVEQLEEFLFEHKVKKILN